MRNTFEYYDKGTYLEHHGIKGQKWGVRRYQNPDGTLTDAGKKKYLNSDGSLNYKGLKKQRKDAIDKDPYGHPTGRGYAGTTAEQRNRKAMDRFKYGNKGFNRIQDKMSTGQGYFQAKRSEDIRYAAKLLVGAAATVAYADLIATGGEGTAKVVSSAAHAAKVLGKEFINNAAGVYMKIPAAQARFDDKMLKYVFG